LANITVTLVYVAICTLFKIIILFYSSKSYCWV